MSEENNKDKKNDVPPKKTGADITGKIPEKIGLSPVEKIISDKYGDVGLQIYNLIDGRRTAEEVMRETGLTESKLVEILDFMDEKGIIKLDYPKGNRLAGAADVPSNEIDKMLETLTVEQCNEIFAFIKNSPVREWKRIDDVKGRAAADKSKLIPIFKFLEKRKRLLLNRHGEFMRIPGREVLNAEEKRLYDKTVARFGIDAFCLYFLIDGKTSIARLRKQIPKAKQIAKLLVDEKLAVFDPYKKGVLFTIKTPQQTDIPAPQLAKLSGRSMKYYEAGIFSRAEEELTKLINSQERVEYYVNRGAALYSQGKYKEAIADFTRAIELDRENIKAFYNRGISYYEKGDYETAMADFTYAIQIKPDFAVAYFMRGCAIESIGKNIPDAIADFEKALQLQPHSEVTGKHLEAVKAKRKLTKTTDNDLFDVVESIPKVRLSDVGGMAKLKDGAISGILYMLKEPEKVKEFGIVFGGGVLLYGPPGCGKSFVTEAIAGEANANRKTVFIRASIAETMNKYVGNSEKNLHNIFEYARARQPAIIFFDEMEALGGAREDIQEHWGRAFVNQFLIEMDQIEKKNEQVLVFGATNSPWFVDYALRRSGRFTEKIFIGPPEEPERKEIFKIHTGQIAPFLDVDYDKLAKATDGFSGADIQALCKDVARNSLVELSRTNMPRKMSTDDFVQAIEQGRKEGKYNSIKEWLDISKRYDKTPPKDGSNKKEWTMFG